MKDLGVDTEGFFFQMLREGKESLSFLVEM